MEELAWSYLSGPLNVPNEILTFSPGEDNASKHQVDNLICNVSSGDFFFLKMVVYIG